MIVTEERPIDETRSNGRARTRLWSCRTGRRDVATGVRCLGIPLESFGYQTILISLSAFLSKVKGWTPETDPSEYTRIRHRQSWGYRFRKTTDAAGLARAAIVAIREERSRVSGNHNTPANGYADILR